MSPAALDAQIKIPIAGADEHQPLNSRRPSPPVGDTALLRTENPDLPFVAPQQPSVPLTLSEALASLEQNLFPALTAVEFERMIARGNLVAALGEFDLQAHLESVPRPLGFYKQDARFISYLEQNVLNDVGSKVLAGYKRNRGTFASWESDETNDGGEFFVGVKQPLLRDRGVDKRRAAVRQAQADVAGVDPAVAFARLQFYREATGQYWSWVAAAANLQIERQLLKLALERDASLRKARSEGLAKPIDQLNNDRVVFERQAKTLAALQKYQQSAVKLSLFFRGADAQPIVPSFRRAPGGERPAQAFPETAEPAWETLADAEATAQLNRPELQRLDAEIRRATVDVEFASNQLLPGVDLVAKASQDVGGPTSKRDKTPFVLEAGVVVDVPLQRRFARGKLEASQGKLAQLQAKRRMSSDKIAAEVQAALSDWRIAWERVDRARRARTAALEVERLERLAFKEGLNDIFRLLLAEAAAAQAAQAEIDALADCFVAEAEFRLALGGVPERRTIPRAGP